MTTEATTEARWYFVHTYSGQEERVERNLKQRRSNMDMGNKVKEVLVPKEEVVEIKGGKRVSTPKKLYPGYIMVRMIMDDESWYVVRNTPGVTGFVSSDDERDKRPKPVPLDQSDVDRILQQIASTAPKTRVGFSKGESVRIIDGPFADFIGVVDAIDSDRGKVTVLVSFFGRETPVELDFLQVDKL